MKPTSRIHCYFINLDRSEDRRNSFAAKARRLGIETRRVPAVLGAALEEEESTRLRALGSGRYLLGDGELGCFLSHRRAWAEIAGETHEWAFVAEDDIHFSASASAFFEHDTWLPPGADIVKAETHGQRTEVAARPASDVHGHDLRRLFSIHRGSAGYFVRRPVAKRLLELTRFRCDPLDEVLFNPELGVADKLMIYQLDPAICIQDFLLNTSEGHEGLESTIETDREQNAHLDPRRRKKRGLGKLKRETSRIADKVRCLTMTRLGRLQVKVIPYGIGEMR